MPCDKRCSAQRCKHAERVSCRPQRLHAGRTMYATPPAPPLLASLAVVPPRPASCRVATSRRRLCRLPLLMPRYALTRPPPPVFCFITASTTYLVGWGGGDDVYGGKEEGCERHPMVTPTSLPHTRTHTWQPAAAVRQREGGQSVWLGSRGEGKACAQPSPARAKALCWGGAHGKQSAQKDTNPSDTVPARAIQVVE